jgi:peptidoglycan/LPS O-acetylase OafA/YrhL
VRFCRFNRGTYRSYLVRIARIHPVRAVALFGYIAVVAAATAVGFSVSTEVSHTSGHVAANSLMLHAFPGAGSSDASAWLVAREMGAYSCFPARVAGGPHLPQRCSW